MKKKVFVLLLAFVMIFSLTACGGDSSAPATGGDAPAAGGDAPAAGGDAPAATSDEKFNIVISYYSSESIPPGQAIVEAAKWCEEQSNGRLTFETYFSGTYVSKGDTMAALKTGQIDMAPIEATQIASVAVLNQIFNILIQSNVPDRAKAQEIYVKMIEEIPELNEELIKGADSFWLYPYVLGGYNWHGTTPIKTFDDIKGKKVEAHAQLGEFMNTIGATAVELDSGDYYNGLKLGTVDAQLTHWAVVKNSQLNEVVNTHTLFGESELASGLNLPAMGYAMNKTKWDSMPQDLQDILKEGFKTAAHFVIDSDTKNYDDAVKDAQERGHEFNFIKGDDRKPWADAMQPILDKWFADCEAAGYDGKGVYDKMMQMFEAA